MPSIVDGGPCHAAPTSQCRAASRPARAGALFLVAPRCGCAPNSITKKPSPKMAGFLCGLCDGDPDELPGRPEREGCPGCGPSPWAAVPGGCGSSLGSREAGSVRGAETGHLAGVLLPGVSGSLHQVGCPGFIISSMSLSGSLPCDDERRALGRQRHSLCPSVSPRAARCPAPALLTASPSPGGPASFLRRRRRR